MRAAPVLALAALLALPGGGLRAQEGGERPSPFKTAPPALDFRGPGREEPEPAVGEVVLGWFGPADPDHPEFAEYWRGATLARDEENAAGGYRGKPFRLEAAWSESPWQAGIAEVTRLVYERGAWAVIGGVDGATTHLAAQIALKARVLLVSPGSTDSTTDHANVPWLFSLAPSDEAVAERLAAAVAESAAGSSFSIVAGTDHDSHATLGACRRALAERRLVPSAVQELGAAEPDLGEAAARAVSFRPPTLVVIAPSRQAGRLLAEVRRTGFVGTVLGGPGLSRTAFARAAGAAAEGVRAPWLTEEGPPTSAFRVAYEARWGERPDEAAAFGYDAVRLAVAAVRRAGLNRPLLRDAVRTLEPWPGAGGVVRWSPLGRSRRSVGLGRWTDGRLLPVP